MVAAPEQVSCDLPDAAVILQLGSGLYYELEHVARRIWSLVQTPIAVTRLRDTLVAEYAVDPARLEADLRTFLAALAAESLIEVRRGAGA